MDFAERLSHRRDTDGRYSGHRDRALDLSQFGCAA
jgi:hypothetical protein